VKYKLKMLNNVILMGRIVADPELKSTDGGKDYTKFKIAVNRYTKDKEHPEADFVPIAVFGQTATTVCNYFKKGDPIIIEGSLRIKNYEDKEGNKRSFTEVIANRIEFVPKTKSKEESTTPAEVIEDDDDLPF
jgi:single-strand DNA-binding protein